MGLLDSRAAVLFVTFKVKEGAVNQLIKLFSYGLLLFLALMVLLFLMSIIAQSDQPIDNPWAVATVAIFMAVISRWFAFRVQVGSSKQALIVGVLWALMLAVILLAIATPNQTAGLLFGRWNTYMIFVGVIAGPLLHQV